jgi:hypothetical protein
VIQGTTITRIGGIVLPPDRAFPRLIMPKFVG